VNSQIHADRKYLSPTKVRLEDRVHGDSRSIEKMDLPHPITGNKHVNHFADPVEGRNAALTEQMMFPARLTQPNRLQALYFFLYFFLNMFASPYFFPIRI